MKAIVIALLFVVATALAKENLQKQFADFITKYHRVYATQEEFQKRYNIFVENMQIAAELTKKNNGSATFGVGPFIDMSRDEFRAKYLIPNYRRNAHQMPVKTSFPKRDLTSFGIPQGPDPNNWDWGSAGVITPVYNQGQCGSCWAFSATETIESYYALAGYTLTQLSMEQIVDCDTGGEDQGCNGGFPTGAYQYVQSAGGLDSYQNYPYTAGNGQAGPCQFPQGSVVATVSSYSAVNGESGLYQQASTAGPVSVCVDASSWQYYTGGILTSCGDSIDHCVQLTGYYNYNGQSGTPAWNVRNSWGVSWGLSGYIQIAIGQDLCGIGDEASIVVAASG